MADDQTITERRIMRNVASDTGDTELALVPDPSREERIPTYKVVGDSKRPVSKHAGNLWHSRKDAAYAKLEKTGRIANWDEAIRYYKNDQRKGRTGSAAKSRAGRLADGSEQDSENIVFANTSALVPSIYAKNPTCEVTANYRDDNEEGGQDDDLKALSDTAERLANTLSSRKGAPGINLKNKARKAVIMSVLTNISYLEVGYTFRDQSSEEALADLDIISEQLANAKDQEQIRELEGQLEALEEKIDFLRPSGPWVKFRHPKDVLRDPDGTEADLTDSKWMMVSDYVSTAYINAVYRERVGPDEWRSIYKPTHVIGASSAKGVEEEINNFSLLKDNLDHRSFGYNEKETYDKALRTKVWYVWDKITRRVYMFNDGDWSWPIWVWDDPYKLETFFPLFPLEFYTDPEDDIANSEVMYYLDQQDAINEVNAEVSKIRKRITGTLFYNTNIIKDPTLIDKFLEGGSTRKAVGVDVPPETEMNKAFFALLPPSAQFLQLLDKKDFYDAASRVSSVQPVMTGQQFKTNTTNDAIETYNSTQQTRLDEKIDAVEDCIGNVLWAVIQMCLQFMTPLEVASILGEKQSQGWRNLTAEEIRTGFSVRIVGGSSQKPTSKIKKQEAIQMGQVLGQYANAGQGAVVMMMLKVMERAFDELVITKEDWGFLQQAIAQSIQNSNPTGAPQGEGGTPQGGEGAQQDPMMALAEIVNALPPEAKEALGTAMARGVPMEEAIPRIVQMIQQQMAE